MPVQGQTHLRNGELHFCHTSCDLLDAGLVEDYLSTVVDWLHQRPNEVVSIILGNGDFVAADSFVGPIARSGVLPFLYVPPNTPMALDDWPTLADMIQAGRRVVLFLDYKADQRAVPYLLDQFSQLWETPFSPTDLAFPCTLDRPPSLDSEGASTRLYLANHNLNTEVHFGDLDILIPNLLLIGQTNSDAGAGSLGEMAQNCQSMSHRVVPVPPYTIL